MRRGTIFLTIALFIGSSLFAQKTYDELVFTELPEIKVPKIVEDTLANGMRLYMTEDHSLPVIEVMALIEVRSLFDPSDKVGFAELTGEVLRTGGAGELSGDEIDRKLDSVGASIEAWIDIDYGGVEFWTLTEYFDYLFPIFAAMLRSPVFAEDKVELAKLEMRTDIVRRNDRAFPIAFREYNKLIYGEESPYARTKEYVTIDNISQADLVAFHKKYFHPNMIKLGITGDFEPAEMAEKIESYFQDWQQAEVDIPGIPVVDYTYRSEVYEANKSDLQQTTIVMGHIGTLLSNPDYPTLTVMNEVLSGSFAGRLFKNVRSTKGLAYAVWGRYTARFDYPGMFYLAAQTDTSNMLETIEAMREEAERLKDEKITEEELQRAKESYLNSFVFRFDNKGEVLRRMIVYDYYGYPRDFLHQMKEKIETVTVADVLQVAEKYLHPDELVILVVGNKENIQEQLKALGEVNEIDIYRGEK